MHCVHLIHGESPLHFIKCLAHNRTKWTKGGVDP
jgi:hypothetical protein